MTERKSHSLSDFEEVARCFFPRDTWSLARLQLQPILVVSFKLKGSHEVPVVWLSRESSQRGPCSYGSLLIIQAAFKSKREDVLVSFWNDTSILDVLKAFATARDSFCAEIAAL